MIGKTVLHYRIIEEVGRGGMGVVYRARDTKLDRDVALKFLPTHLSNSADEKARFLQEAKAAATLNHPNICTIHSIEEHDGQLFIVMQMVDGELLRGRMKNLGQKEAIDIAVQIAEGLAAAHQQGIVHRDIKPENVMVRRDGIVQIMDFGLAKVRGGSQLTQAGTTVGTIRYMSPEQIQGLDVDPRADLFSFGALLYEMISGRTPFQGDHDAAVMYEIVNMQPQGPSSLKQGIPAELERIVMKCLAKDRDERYQSARDIAVDLRVLQKHSGSGIHAAPKPAFGTGTPTDPGAGKRSRTPLVVALASLVLVVCLASAWYFFGRSSGAPIASIVVLPFENVGADPDLDYLSEGVTEGIINKVSGIPDLRVIPRSAAFRFKGSGKDPQTIGRELEVDAALSGRVVQRGSGLDITLELIDVREYSQIWGQTYKRTMNDLLTVQDEIVSAVSGKLRPGDKGTLAAAGRETSSAEAYRLYLQGKFHWNKRTAPDLERALGYFNQAVQLDRSFARAHLGLAETYLMQGQYSDRPSSEIIPLAGTEAQRALELEGSLGEAHATLGMIAMLDWDWDTADKEFGLAVEKAPGYATSYQWYSIFLGIMGRDEEAFNTIRKGVDLDPYSPIISMNLAIAYLRNDDIEPADKIITKILEIDPGFFFANLYRAYIQFQRGNREQAVATLNAMPLPDKSSDALGFLGNLYARIGEVEKAKAILRDLLNDYEHGHVGPVAIASIYCGLKDPDNAMKWLNTAYASVEKSRSLPITRGFFEFNILRNDPRYIELMKKVGLK